MPTDQEMQATLKAEIEALQDRLRLLLTRDRHPTNYKHAGNLARFIADLGATDAYKVALVADSILEGGSLSEGRTDMRILDLDLAAHRVACQAGYNNKALTEQGGLPDFSLVHKALTVVVGTELTAAHAQATRAYRWAAAGVLPLPAVLRDHDAWNPHDDE